MAGLFANFPNNLQPLLMLHAGIKRCCSGDLSALVSVTSDGRD